jgi:sorting nexin-4
MMDVDPEATRRANIGKTRDNISQLEDSLQASAQDLKYASTTLQADLDRFQRQKVADVRLMTIEIATLHREWCRQTLDAWKVAQAAIREIPDHPNKAPPEPPALQLGLEASLDRDLPPVPEHRRKSPAMPPIVSRSPPSDTDPLGSMPTSPFKSEPADPLDVEKHRTSPPVRNLSRTSSATAPVSAESLATSASAAAAATAPPAQSPPAVVSPPATSPPMSPPKAYTGNAKSDNEDDAAGPLGPL